MGQEEKKRKHSFFCLTRNGRSKNLVLF